MAKRFRRPAHWTLAQTLAHYSIPGPAMAVFRATGKYEDIGAQFGVSIANVSMIKNKSRWAHIHGS